MLLQIACLLGLFLSAFLTALLAVSLTWGTAQVRAARNRRTETNEEEPQSGSGLLRDDDISTIAFWGSVLLRFSHVHTLRKCIAEANLDWTAGRVAAAMLAAGAVVYALAGTVGWLAGLPALGLAVFAFSCPYLYIRGRRARRFAAFATQFPDALDSLSRAMKAGYPLSAAVELLAREYPQPLSAEMRRVREEYRLGVSWDVLLNDLAERIPIAEVRLFSAAVKMQNRMGGKLNDVLGRLSETMRDSAALEGEVRSISAHSRITGMVLTVMPVAIGLLMLAVNPAYILTFIMDPTGRLLLTLAAASNIGAHFLIRKIVQIRL